MWRDYPGARGRPPTNIGLDVFSSFPRGNNYETLSKIIFGSSWNETDVELFFDVFIF